MARFYIVLFLEVSLYYCWCWWWCSYYNQFGDLATVTCFPRYPSFTN